MGGFLLRKVGAALIVILLASMLVFLGVRALPGDPALALGAENRDPAVLAAIRAQVRPRPADAGPVRAVARLASAGRPRHRPARAPGRPHDRRRGCRSRSSSPASRSCSASVLGILAGVIAAVRRGKAADYAATTVALVGLSVPHFWLGLLMIVLFAVDLHWLPAGGYVPFTRGPDREPRAHGHARDRARHRAVGGGDAADALVDARLARRRLRPNRAREGAAASARSSASTRCGTA